MSKDQEGSSQLVTKLDKPWNLLGSSARYRNLCSPNLLLASRGRIGKKCRKYPDRRICDGEVIDLESYYSSGLSEYTLHFGFGTFDGSLCSEHCTNGLAFATNRVACKSCGNSAPRAWLINSFTSDVLGLEVGGCFTNKLLVEFSVFSKFYS